MRRLRGILLLMLAGLAVPGTSRAADFGPPVQNLHTWHGRVTVERQESSAELVLVDDSGKLHQRFRVEADLPAGFPASFAAEAAELLAWEGNLVVVAPGEGQALHFTIPSINRETRLNAKRRGLELLIDPRQVDADLASRYRLTRIDTVSAILAKGGPAALVPFEPVAASRGMDKSDIVISHDDVPGEPGLGSCVKSCTADCGDGSTCAITCGTNRCGHCDCPLLCSCTFRPGA
jgi:hypothetical protein